MENIASGSFNFNWLELALRHSIPDPEILGALVGRYGNEQFATAIVLLRWGSPALKSIKMDSMDSSF